MSDDSVEIRRQMAHTRAEMSSTLEQLQTRLDPVVLEERAKTAAYDATIGKVSNMVQRTSNGFVETIKQNPVPLALTALGIGWFVMGSRSTRVAETAQATVRDVAHEAQMRGREVQSTAVRTYRANPLAIGLGVMAVGLAIGMAIPETRKEDEWLGATRDKLLEKAQATGQQALGKVNEQLAKPDQPPQQEPSLDLQRTT